MNFDPTYIIDIIAVVSTIITVAILWSTIRDVRNNTKKDLRLKKTQAEIDLSDYDQIIRATHEIETERQRNQGAHFEDETVYLNRAKLIREKSAFFSWVK